MSAFALRSQVIDNQLQSPLLRLPGELRNRVYEYVFDSETDKRIANLVPACPRSDATGPCVVAYRARIDVESEPDTEWVALRPINNLKYVCRKLYLETRGMVNIDQYKTLKFPHVVALSGGLGRTSIYCAAATALRFLEECDANHLRQLHRVEIDETNVEHALTGDEEELEIFGMGSPDAAKARWKVGDLLELRTGTYWIRREYLPENYITLENTEETLLYTHTETEASTVGTRLRDLCTTSKCILCGVWAFQWTLFGTLFVNWIQGKQCPSGWILSAILNCLYVYYVLRTSN